MASSNLSSVDFTPAQNDTSTLGNDVFISYSRKDKAFVETLDTAFRRLNRDPWVDWNDIQKGEEWWAAIERGIEASNTFVFVISPDSVASSVCRNEIEHAAKHNKRFLPIVRREGFEMRQVHPAISRHNWLFFRETDNFEPAFQDLLKALNTDLDYVRAHTRLLLRAIEWQNKRRNQSYLLRGVDLRESEQWLLQGAGKTPQPTRLQIDYINASRTAKAATLRARQKATWIVVLTTVLANMLLAIGGGYWYFKYATAQTTQQLQDNLIRALNAGLIGIDGDEFAALAETTSSENVPPPINNALYQKHQDWLYRVHTVFPKATFRTYVGSKTPNVILWIGDVARDLNTNKTNFRQPYNAQYAEAQIYNGRATPTIVMTPYTDSLGRWVSATGPIKNFRGQVVGGLNVYLKEDYIQRVQGETRQALIVGYVIIFAWLLALSLIILRVTRPSNDDFVG